MNNNVAKKERENENKQTKQVKTTGRKSSEENKKIKTTTQRINTKL